jgi:hypothetical protein
MLSDAFGVALRCDATGMGRGYRPVERQYVAFVSSMVKQCVQICGHYYCDGHISFTFFDHYYCDGHISFTFFDHYHCDGHISFTFFDHYHCNDQNRSHYLIIDDAMVKSCARF